MYMRNQNVVLKRGENCSDGKNSDEVTEVPAIKYPPYLGPKHVIAVLPFAIKVRDVDGADQLGEGLTEMLVTELVRSDRYLVVEREAIADIVKEQEMGMSGLVQQATAPKVGQMAGAQYMIRGAVTEFNDAAGGGGLTLGFKGGKVGGGTRSAYLGVDVRIVDNSSGQVFASYNTSAKARSARGKVGTNFTHLGDQFQIGTSGYFSQALGIAARKAIQQVVRFIMIESKSIPWQGSIIKAGSKTFINRGSNANIKVGDQLWVYAPGEALIDPETGFNLGSDEERLCQISVSQVKDKFSVARQEAACAGRGMKRGDIIRFK